MRESDGVRVGPTGSWRLPMLQTFMFTRLEVSWKLSVFAGEEMARV